MIKVKEYLDDNFYRIQKCIVELKSNGHYSIQGTWFYPKECVIQNSNLTDYIILNINNETIMFHTIKINGKYEGIYRYLQTYEHLSRNKPDINGYYARSTEQEIINYINSYFFQIKNKERYPKIKKIMNKIKK